MASVSVPAAVPIHMPFDAAPDMPVPLKPIHSRRTSRNPNLAPLPAFTFNPGAMESMQDEQQSSSVSTDLDNEVDVKEASRRGPPPLPIFSFNPGAATQPESDSSSPTHPILEEMAQNRSRRTSRPAALPAFGFNPGCKETQTTPSPTKSSFASDPPTPARSVGHRRGASEFIGAGDGPQPPSTPPFSVSPQRSTLGPPVTGYRPQRPSHQHRRSQAVSISEIETSDLIKTNAVSKHRTGSVPSTPTDLPSNDHFSRATQSISSLYGRTPPTSPHRRASATGTRPRVGFSDTIDVIPRPLSMISSETEGSTSTVRGNHSLTGSITSLGTPAARSSPAPGLDDSFTTQRPKTADAASPSSKVSAAVDTLDMCGLPKRSLSASDSTSLFAGAGSPGSRKRFWFTSGASDETSLKTKPKRTPTLEETEPVTSMDPFEGVEHASRARRRPKPAPERKASIKKRKVRTIAGAIFSRKARSRAAQSRARRTPTPPLNRSFSNKVTDVVFDDDHTVVITNSLSAEQDNPRGPPLPTHVRPHSPPSGYQDDFDDRLTNSVIDLDAALGTSGSEEKLPQSGFAAARTRMHSSMSRGVPDAFGVIHRRAESAPQMPPVDRSTFGMPRLSNNANVAEDVFDEEEEDEFLAGEGKPRAESDPTLGQGAVQGAKSPTSSGSSDAVRDNSASPSRRPGSLTISTDVLDGVEIVDAEEDISRETARSSESTLSAPTISEPEVKQSAPSTLSLAYPAPQASYASSGEGRSAPSSAISSPDADHVNFDHYPRFARHKGEASPDPGVRSSTEDVPSLCDSVSTGNAPRFSSGAATRSSADQHSDLFPAPSTGRNSKPQQAWKRASLASLNRLIPGSSHSEKSRLRFEEPAEDQQEERARRKGNRISRLMNFWRSKEKENK